MPGRGITRRVLAAALAVGLLTCGAAVAATAPKKQKTPAKRAQVLDLKLSGGTRQPIAKACGLDVAGAVASPGTKVEAVVTLGDKPKPKPKRKVGAKPKPGAKGSKLPGTILLAIERCELGKWAAQRTIEMGIRPGAHTRRIGTAEAGDYRLSASYPGYRDRGAAKSRAAYMRIGAGGEPTVTREVEFAVKNTNTSGLSCATDGKDYTVRGTLVTPLARVAPSAKPANRTVTLYLHGLAFGRWFWGLDAPKGYDHATEMAKLGHASVIIDRLGYDGSDHPDGKQSCVGGQADIAHQVIGALRGGGYKQATAGDAPAFAKIALAGHSAGGAIAEVEAWSFADIDALAVMSWANQGNSNLATSEFGRTSTECTTDPQPAEPGSPSGYAYFGQEPADFGAAMFHKADADVVAAATARRNLDPCGDTGSILPALLTNPGRLDEVTVPVLVLAGKNDALFPPAAMEDEKAHFTGSKDLSYFTLEETGHAITLEQSAPKLRLALSGWLGQRGF